jgi:uncharacterized protein YgiM (DUF1202 family)
MGGCGHLGDVRGLVGYRVDRRTILKASAAFGAMAALGGTIPRLTRAQSAGGTHAATWSETNADTSVQAKAASIVPAQFTFFAAAPHWSGDADPGGQVKMSFSADGKVWHDPVTITESSADAGRPDRDNRRFGKLAFVDGANYIRYETADAAGDPAPLPDLAFTYIDASDGPSVDDVFSPAAVPSLSPPPIISREMWGADERYRHEDDDLSAPLLWPPDYQTVEHVIIHHTVTPNFQDPLIAIRSIYYYHAVTRGWGDIGYNYLVDFMGNVYEGRAGGENVVGGHAYQYAHGSSGIGTMGTFSSVQETPETQAGLIWITAWTGRNLDPLGHSDFHEQNNLPTICGHRDVLDTDCPGDALYADLDWIRTSVADVLSGAATPGVNQTFSEGDVVSVNTDAINLRTGPGTDFDVVAVMPNGTVLQILDGPTTTDGYTWYQVTSTAGVGWCADEFLALSDAAPPPPPPSDFSVGDHIVISTDALNLREGPGLDYRVSVVVPGGTAGTIDDGPSAADGYNWFKLNTSDGSGWGVDVYFTSDPNPGPTKGQFSAGDSVIVATDALNLRSGPSTGRDVVDVMPNGTELTIIGGPTNAGGYLWYEVTSDAYGDGWCVAQYLAVSGSTPTGKFAPGDELVADTDALNLRNGPSTDSDVIAVMPTGTSMTVTDGPRNRGGYVWYKVRTSDYGTGWCVDAYLARAGGSGFAKGDFVYVSTDALNLRSDDRASASVRAVMPTGTRLKITGGPTISEGYSWYKVDSDTFGSGWCAGDFLSLVTPDSGNGITKGTTVRVIEGALNLRSSAALDADVVAVLSEGARLTITGGPTAADGYTWYRVRSTSAGDGWCAGEFLEPV